MRARTVYESISFTRGMDPKASIGIGKFGTMVKELSELYTDILPSYTLKFENIPSADLDKEPHKFIGTVEPLTRNGRLIGQKDRDTIREMLDSFKQSYIDRLVNNGFYPIGEKFGTKYITPFMKSFVFTILYDEMSNQFDKINR